MPVFFLILFALLATGCGGAAVELNSQKPPKEPSKETPPPNQSKQFVISSSNQQKSYGDINQLRIDGDNNIICATYIKRIEVTGNNNKIYAGASLSYTAIQDTGSGNHKALYSECPFTPKVIKRGFFKGQLAVEDMQLDGTDIINSANNSRIAIQKTTTIRLDNTEGAIICVENVDNLTLEASSKYNMIYTQKVKNLTLFGVANQVFVKEQPDTEDIDTSSTASSIKNGYQPCPLPMNDAEKAAYQKKLNELKASYH